MDEESETPNNNNDSKSCSALTMTSFDHDDSIEIISSHVVSTPATDSVFTELTSIDVSTCDYDVPPCQKALPEDRMLVLTGGPSKKKIVPIPSPPSKQQKRIKSAVMVLGTLLIGMSLVLVAVTLAMSDHIDEMVRKLNGQTTTPASVPTTKPYNVTG